MPVPGERPITLSEDLFAKWHTRREAGPQSHGAQLEPAGPPNERDLVSSGHIDATAGEGDSGMCATTPRFARLAVAVLLAGGIIYGLPGSVAAKSPPASAPIVTAGRASPILRPGPAGFSAAPRAQSVPAVAAADESKPAEPLVWTLDLYDSAAVRWQDPDPTACTAASTLSMLNTVALAGLDPSLVWRPTTSYATQEKILAFERSHMTMNKTSDGADPHGWRNALNYFGWGSMKAGVYVDASYKSFDAAAKAVVRAIATTARPVGILAEYGRHAEFVTGYKVRGADPSTGSSDFTVIGVYLTDPHEAAGHRDTWVTYSRWKTGEWRIQFTEFGQVDSPGRDPLDHHVGRKEWLGKWVIVAPVR